MSGADRTCRPIMIDEDDYQNAARIEEMLQESSGVRLIGSEGKEIPLPGSIAEAFAAAVHALARNHAVSVIPMGRQLTTQQAADLLQVSRPYLIKLLDTGLIPSTKAGTHRRVRLDDVLAFRDQRDTARRQGLTDLVRLTEELGLYEEDEMPGPPRREEDRQTSINGEPPHGVGDAEHASQA